MANNIKTKHYDVFNYWKDKCIDKLGNIYREDNCDYNATIPIVEDWGEPMCYACGQYAINYDGLEEDDYRKYKEDLMMEDDSGLKHIYSRKDVKHNLQLAHIRPKALCGDDSPENFMLLCPRCHRDAPDIINKNVFLSWIYKRRKEGGIYKRSCKKAFEILREDYNINPYLIPIDYKNALSLRNINSHGSIIVEDTYTYAIIQEALLNKTKLKEEYEIMFKYMINEEIKKIKSKYNINSDTYSDVDEAIIETLQNVLNQYEMFKKMETYNAA